MQSKKASKKKDGFVEEKTAAASDSSMLAETKAKPRAAKSSKPQSETGEASSAVKRHRKAEPATVSQEIHGHHHSATAPVIVEALETSASASGKTARPANSEQEIRELAFAFWLARGCGHGSSHEDWMRAERELKTKA